MAKRKVNRIANADNIFYNFEYELKEALGAFTDEIFQQVQEGIGRAADFMKDKLEAATPVDTGETQKQWVRTTKYKNVQYIGNNAVTEKGIPVVNLLEFAPNGKPFVRKTFEANASQALDIIKNEIKK